MKPEEPGTKTNTYIEEPDNVIRLPKEWIGPLHELVPMGRDAADRAPKAQTRVVADLAEGADADDFWGGDGTWNASLDDEAPADAKGAVPRQSKLRRPIQVRRAAWIPSRRTIASLVVALLVFVAARAVIDGGGETGAGRSAGAGEQFVNQLRPALTGLASLTPAVTAAAQRAVAVRPPLRARRRQPPVRARLRQGRRLVQVSATAAPTKVASGASATSATSPATLQSVQSVSPRPSSYVAPIQSTHSDGGSGPNRAPQVPISRAPAAAVTPSSPAGLGSCVSNC